MASEYGRPALTVELIKKLFFRRRDGETALLRDSYTRQHENRHKESVQIPIAAAVANLRSASQHTFNFQRSTSFTLVKK